MSNKSDVEEIRSSLRKISDRRSLREIAGEVGVSHTTLYEFLGGGAPSERTERLVREWLAAGAREAGEMREWADDMLDTVRFLGGDGEFPPEERRLRQIDVLNGMIRLGKVEGKDVRKLEALRDELRAQGPLPPPPPPVQRSVEEGVESTELARWVDEVNRLDVPEGLKIMKLDALAATIRAEMARQDAEASKIRARAIDTAEEAADARARTVERAEETATARARAVEAGSTPAVAVSELSGPAKAAVELFLREIAAREERTPALPAHPGSPPEGPRPRPPAR